MDKSQVSRNSDQKKKKLRKKISGLLKKIWSKVQPADYSRKGAGWAIFIALLILTVFYGIYVRPGFEGILNPLSGVLIFLIFVSLAFLAAALVLKVLSVLPIFITQAGLISLIVLIIMFIQFGFPFFPSLLTGLSLGLAFAFLGGGLATIFREDFRFERSYKKILIFLAVLIPIAVIVYLGYWLFFDQGGKDHLPVFEPKLEKIAALDADNPSRPGSFDFKTLTYGSGDHKRRPEFAEEIFLKTRPVDAAPFVKENKSWTMLLRKWYWGFDFDKFPLNGRVWYPLGEGPFPLVLIVHGNHKMQEYSDPGYAYLGELLASRGFIFVSVDENFFNGAFFCSLSRENDGRGWLLLQHLIVWREWNRTVDNIFFGKVDMDNIGLIGHSRGGEAAAIAGCFNRLSHYPDDALVEFDFDFNIKAIAAIAPSDGQYRPAGQPTPLENVNYLVLQGAHDADVSTFAGMRQFQRIRFTDDNYWFKASIYSYRSNHGQFNTVWKDNDWGKPRGFILNKEPLLEGEDQRKISKVYISAFLEAVLHGNNDYLQLFQDYRTGMDWLPDDIYINRFEDSTFKVICGYEEDVNVTTGTMAGVFIKADGLKVWREEDLSLRRRGTKQNNVVYVGWRRNENNREQLKPVYIMDLPENKVSDLGITRNSLLVFDLANTEERVPDRDTDKSVKNEYAERQNSSSEIEDEAEKEIEKNNSDEPLDFTIELTDGQGDTAVFALSSFIQIPPVLKSRFTKFRGEAAIYGKAYEPTLQTIEVPFENIVSEFPDFDPETLRIIRFVFDITEEGVLIIDRIGISNSGSSVK